MTSRCSCCAYTIIVTRPFHSIPLGSPRVTTSTFQFVGSGFDLSYSRSTRMFHYSTADVEKKTVQKALARE